MTSPDTSGTEGETRQGAVTTTRSAAATLTSGSGQIYTVVYPICQCENGPLRVTRCDLVNLMSLDSQDW